MAESRKKLTIDLAAGFSSELDEVFDGGKREKGTRRSTPDSSPTVGGSMIDAFYVSSEEHIDFEKLKKIYGVISEVTEHGKIRGDAAQELLNASPEYQSAVQELTSTESNKEVIGAMAHKEVAGKTRIDAFTLNTEVKSNPLTNPITITIKLKSGVVLFWNMPQQELYIQTSNGEKQKIDDVKAAEEKYHISLPRNEECILAPGQERSSKIGDDLELDPSGLVGSSKTESGTKIDFGSRVVVGAHTSEVIGSHTSKKHTKSFTSGAL
ncbi:MAG: hypothetical protein PHY80_00380 [Rickettsiales bacterium]|nr:hypothetical protein [Rickettsiales bacterium]